MAGPTVVQVIVEFKDREISNVLPHAGDVTVSRLTDADRKKLKRSKDGLRRLETLSKRDPNRESLAAARKCFIVIGGFKVQVPCG